MSRRLVLLVAVVVASLGLTAVAIGQQRSDAAAWCSSAARLAQQRDQFVTGHGLRVAVLGDSYARGYRLADPDQSWPTQLADIMPARVATNAFDGSGFTDANHCGVPYSSRAAAVLANSPDLVIVQGGLNDYAAPPADVRAGFRTLMRELDGTRVVVVGPTRAPHVGGAGRVDRLLRSEADRAGVEYMSAYEWRLPFSSDGVHLTPTGHRMFAERLAAAVVRGSGSR